MDKVLYQAEKKPKSSVSNKTDQTGLKPPLPPTVSPPTRAKSAPSPTPTGPAVKLKQREKPLQLAQQLADYVDKLPPVNFSYFDYDPKNPYSLPTTVGSIFVQEELMDDKGQIIFEYKGKLNNPRFVHQLENKVLFALIHNYIQNSIYHTLKQAFDDPEMMPTNLEHNWGSLISLLSDYYALQASTLFFSERYPDRLIKAKVLSRLPLSHVNKSVREKMAIAMEKDKDKLLTTCQFFVQSIDFIKDKKKSQLCQQAADILLNQIPLASQCLLNMKLNFNTDKFPEFDINYYSE